MNRFFRRHKDKDPDENPNKNPEHAMREQGTNQDVTSTRAKNTRHKKVTADKWNQ
jgi:hypothetical protein